MPFHVQPVSVATTRGRRGPVTRPSPPVGVVMITMDRRAEVLSTLDRLAALTPRPPVVLVDNGSRDGTVEAVERDHPAVTCIRLERNVGAAARNVGIAVHKSPLIAFCDDDSWWHAEAFDAAAAAFDRHPRIALIGGRVLVGPDETIDPISRAMAQSPIGTRPGYPGPLVLGFLACGAVVRRTAFLQAGGFRPEYGVGGEEAVLALDLAARGWDLVYHPGVVAHHHPSPQRNQRERERREVRNDLWTTWLRLPLSTATRAAWRAMRATPQDASARAGLRAAAASALEVLADRQVVPAGVAAMAAALERG
jgi:GT2 family glycosyltransferase